MNSIATDTTNMTTDDAIIANELKAYNPSFAFAYLKCVPVENAMLKQLNKIRVTDPCFKKLYCIFTYFSDVLA